MAISKKNAFRFWRALFIDLLIACLLCGLLAVYFLLLPRYAVGQELTYNGETRLFTLPGSDRELTEAAFKNKKGDIRREVLETYADSEKQVVLTKNSSGEGDEKLTWYTADIFVRDVTAIKANVSVDENGQIVNRSVLRQAQKCGALLAITGDTFSMSDDGVIVRNGLLYRGDVRTYNDVCALCRDGTMKIYERKDLYTTEMIARDGAWQVFTFGPSLLDGSGRPRTSFHIAASHLSDLSLAHPRTVIGMVEPGHFIFVTVDGRDPGYSRGVTFPELAQLMADEGCVVAYNLDGGRSSVMTYDGRIVNSPYKDGRGISDIVYIAKEEVSE